MQKLFITDVLINSIISNKSVKKTNKKHLDLKGKISRLMSKKEDISDM